MTVWMTMQVLRTSNVSNIICTILFLCWPWDYGERDLEEAEKNSTKSKEDPTTVDPGAESLEVDVVIQKFN